MYIHFKQKSCKKYFLKYSVNFPKIPKIGDTFDKLINIQISNTLEYYSTHFDQNCHIKNCFREIP